MGKGHADSYMMTKGEWRIMFIDEGMGQTFLPFPNIGGERKRLGGFGEIGDGNKTHYFSPRRGKDAEETGTDITL